MTSPTVCISSTCLTFAWEAKLQCSKKLPMTFQKAKARLGVLGYQDPRLTEVNTDASKKISRVVRSTLSAEAFSMSRSVDKIGWCRLLWGTLIIPEFQWRSPPVAIRQMHAAVIVTNCKSLFDLASRRAMLSCEEYRTTLEVLLMKKVALNIVSSGGFQLHCDWLIL